MPDDRDCCATSSVLPVTALAFIETDSQHESLLLLAGQGNEVRAFDIASAKPLSRRRALDDAVIRGIRCQNSPESNLDGSKSWRCLIFGGRSATILLLTQHGTREAPNVTISCPTKAVEADGWLLDACISPVRVWNGHEPSSFAAALFISGGNVLTAWLATRLECGQCAFEHSLVPVAIGPRASLLSAHVIWIEPGVIAVAAGTAFGKVYVWTCSLPENVADRSSNDAVQPIESFLGHEGSIFGARFFHFTDFHRLGPTTLLGTCSDDRTVRLWRLGNPLFRKLYVNQDGMLTLDESADSIESVGLGVSSKECFTPALGHFSRIWNVRSGFLDDGSIYVFSFGEDARVLRWDVLLTEADVIGGDRPASLILKSENAMSPHAGRNIWSGETHRNHHQIYVATGGADGGIVLGTDDHKSNTKTWSFEASEITTSNAKPLEETSDHSSAKAMLLSMQGRWRLDRRITSHASNYPSGQVSGFAELTARNPKDPDYDLELLYSEKGDFLTETGLKFQASRFYVYRHHIKERKVSAWFAKPDNYTADYLFHEIDLMFGGATKSQDVPCGGSGYHLCIQDHYNASYSLDYEGTQLNSWSLSYSVKGPQKDYTSEASYVREDSYDQSSLAIYLTNEIDQPTNAEKGVEGMFQKYSWLNSRTFLVTTSSGDVLIGSLPSDCSRTHGIAEAGLVSSHSITWTTIGHAEDLTSSLIMSNPENGTVLVSGDSGWLYLYRISDQLIRPLLKVEYKVSGIFLSPKLEWPKLHFVVTCIGTQQAFSISIESLLEREEYEKHIQVINLPVKFLPTCSYFHTSQILILGSRQGSLGFFDLGDSSSQFCGPLFVSHDVHGQEAVTSINTLPHLPEYEQYVYLFTTGRDGNLAIHRFKASLESNLALETVHRVETTLGLYVEGAIYHEASQEIFTWGFQSSRFVVWNPAKHQEIMSVECGGAHRSWAFFPSRIGHGGNFIWTKASVCNVFLQAEPSRHILQAGSHGREIKALAVCPDSSTNIVATGAEDTDVRILEYVSSNGDLAQPFQTLGVISKHSAGIQKLAWSLCGRYLFSAAGREEFYAWNIGLVPCLRIGIVRAGKCPPVTESKDLRITDFDVKEDFNGDRKNEPEFNISMAYSDSTVRQWRFVTSRSEFVLLATGSYSTCCLTQIQTLSLGNRSLIVTASTDGHIAVWDSSITSLKNDREPSLQSEGSHTSATSAITWVSRHRVHQSSIKALVLIKTSEEETLVITGGDDNAIALTRLCVDTSVSHGSLQDRKDGLTLTTLIIPRAHASAVNTLTVLFPPPSYSSIATGDKLSDGKEISIGNSAPEKRIHGKISDQNGFTVVAPDETESSSRCAFNFVSASNDQCLRQWHAVVDLLKPGTEGVFVHRVNMRRSGVADAACSGVLGDRSVIVAGVGMEVWMTD